jgi:hypothetical protein
MTNIPLILYACLGLILAPVIALGYLMYWAVLIVVNVVRYTLLILLFVSVAGFLLLLMAIGMIGEGIDNFLKIFSHER